MSASVGDSEASNVSTNIADVVAAARAGDYEQAYRLAGAAIAEGSRDAVLFEIVANWLIRQGPQADVATALESLNMLATGDPVLLVRTGLLLLRIRRPFQALELFDSAVVLRPDFARAHYERGVAFGILGRVEDMRMAHELAIALEPANADALGSLALIAARTGDSLQARSYASRSLESRPNCALAGAALALVDIRDGNFAQAQNRLDVFLADKALINDTWMDIAVSDAGDAFARQNRFPQAFAAYAAVGERRRNRQLATLQGRRAIDAVNRRIAYFRGSATWRPEETGDQDTPALGHVFVLGFMRSGTTLLETVLAGHPSICAMDEREFLADAARRYLFADETLDELRVPDEAELAAWRGAYWNAVKETGADVAGRIFVNKMPFNSLRLPLIARLFPEARILFAVRDPRDVVLSCFRHRFEANQLTFEFLRLDDCARFYAATMQLVELCRQKLMISVHEHRYEDLIDDFDASVSAVCRFIGVDWNDAMRDFVAASGVIAPRSQSAEQVRRGLYRGGIGQWRPYAAQLQPVMPDLSTWIARFGYPAD